MPAPVHRPRGLDIPSQPYPLAQVASRLPADGGSKKGFSAHQMHRTLKVDYKTAWFMEHRIRECMDDDASGPIGGEGKTIEADESFVTKQRGRAKWEFSNERGWVKTRDRRQLVIFALVERGGKARAMPIDD